MLFSSEVLFELPVLPRVQKYIRHKLTDETGQAHPLLLHPLAFGAGSMLWFVCQTPKKQLFSNYSYWKGPNETLTESQRKITFDLRLTARLGVGICEFHYSRNQYLLNYLELDWFSNLIDHLIHNELVTFCDQQPDVAPMVRIKAFCDQYDFAPNELSETALKQMYLRYRKGKAASNYSPALTRSFEFLPVAA